MTQRFFASSDMVYEAVRAQLDAAFGLPANGQETCITPAASAPHDESGRVLLSVNEEFCEYPSVSEMLPGLIASGAVEEITAEQYADALANLTGA